MILLNKNSKKRILIVDDNKIFRETLKFLISQTPDMTVTAEAGDGNEAIDTASKDDFDIVILDIAMPGRDGLNVLKELKIRKPHLPTLILSMFPAEQYELAASMLGADGYIRKDDMADQLIEAIKRILNGGKYFNVSLTE
jgi:two-component system invasion response regulator UvrY